MERLHKVVEWFGWIADSAEEDKIVPERISAKVRSVSEIVKRLSKAELSQIASLMIGQDLLPRMVKLLTSRRQILAEYTADLVLFLFKIFEAFDLHVELMVAEGLLNQSFLRMSASDLDRFILVM